jgi:Mce-associated membrane protein
VPPHRRRPAPSAGQAPPIRRPKVAGRRNRPDQHADEANGTDEAVESSDRVTGLLTGVRGTKPPAPTDEDDAAETSVLPRVTDPEPEIDPETNEPPAVTDDAEAEDADDAEPEKAEATTKTVPKPRPKPRPDTTRPAGKRRATGTSRPTDLAAAESDAGSESRRSRHAQADERPIRTKAQTQISVAIILAVVAVVLAGLAVFFRGKANDLNSGDTNTALTDTATTSQVKGQLTNAIKETFSYNYTDLASTEKAVKENLTGKALCEYDLLFGEVKKYAPEQKIVLDTTVRELAVVRIDGDRAEALVYIDQLSTRVDVNKTVAVGGQFAVQAHRDGDHWKITEFDMFGQPLFNGKPAPTC